LKKTTFLTPQEAEAAFYEALERGDLDAMMEVWAEDDEVSCIHPGGPRLTGYEQVREAQGQTGRSIVVATNVYMRAASGWRMVLHHGSPAPAPVVRRDVPVEAPKVLH